MLNSTVVRNRADADGNGSGDGGGIFSQVGLSQVPELVARNSIVAENVDGGGESPDCGPRLNLEGRNLVQDASGCALSGAVGDVIGGVSPMLGPLQSNGGPTATHALLDGSPARDAGAPAVPGTGGAACEIVDQRGIVRPQPPACDVGAYEVPVPLCSTVASGCVQAAAGKSRLELLRSSTKPHRLQWKWAGPGSTLADLGTPPSGTSYTLCVFDVSGGVPSTVFAAIVPGGPCESKPCWKANTKGFGYRNRAATPNGIDSMQLKAAAIGVKGAGPLLSLPSLPLDQDPSIVVQLVRTDGGACWGATFSSHLVNDGEKFDAKAD